MPDSIDKLTTSRSIQWVRKLDLFSPWNRYQILGAGFSALCALAIFLVLPKGTSTPIGELDPSWQAVLEFATQKRLQFGSEIIFYIWAAGLFVSASWFWHVPFAAVYFSPLPSAELLRLRCLILP